VHLDLFEDQMLILPEALLESTRDHDTREVSRPVDCRCSGDRVGFRAAGNRL
jgi:hypothetical protein